jgi:hypothetical protein
MSNKNNSNNTRKSKRTKVDSNPIKKPVNNTPKKVNDPELYCNNCGVFLDNIKNYHYVFSDDFGELDVCGKCFDELNEENSNISTNSFNPSLNPNIPSLSLSKGIVPNGLGTDLPKIRLVFLNPTNSNCNSNTVGNDSNTNNSTQKTLEIEKTNDRNKNKDKNEDKNKDKKNKTENACQQNASSRSFTPPNVLGGNNTSKCSSTGCEENKDNSSLLFFQQILNRLHGIETSSNRATSQDEDVETDTEEEDDTPLEFEWLGDNIKTIDDLITIGKSYDSRKRKRYNLNLKQLNKLVAPLEELKAMVGMADVKKIIFDQLIYYLQNLDDKNVDMLHTVIVGPPGVGKTQLTHIIAKIYNRLGFLKTDKVVCAKRDDLIGEYIGQTAPKTRKVLERALGGVLLLDEIYSLAPTSDRDFAREAIDMINMYLSEHAHDLVCVVAGYKKPTYEKFFSQNEGLARRFTHHFEIKGYTHDELTMIFKKYLESQKWSLGASLEEIGEIIKGHMEIFPNFGGDMATLFACCKKAHSRRLLRIPTEAELTATKKKIQKSDILEAVVIYKEIKEKHSSSEVEDKAKYMHMYA